MVEHIRGLSGERDLIDKLALTKSSRTGSMPSVSSRPRLNLEPMTAAALRVRLAAGSSRSMRAAMVACKVAGTLTSQTSAVETYAPRLPAQHTTLGQFAHHLFGEKRVSCGLLDDHGGQPTDRGVRAEQLSDQCGGLGITQRRQGDALSTGSPGSTRPEYSGR